MKFTDQDGKEWEFRGEYRIPRRDTDQWLNCGGAVEGPYRDTVNIGVRAIVHPVPKRYSYGGVVFEETGEKRRPKQDEYATDRFRLFHCTFTDESEFDLIILRPVALEG